MNDDDLLDLIELVSREFEAAGLEEIADPARYEEPDLKTGESRALAPAERLLEMLRAFERVLRVEDSQTHDRALKVINRSLAEGEIEEVLVMPIAGERLPPIALAEAPRLGEVRERLQGLMAVLSETVAPRGGRR